MKVLIIQQKMIGDVLVSSLLCEHLRLHIPQAVIHYLVNEHTTAVVENNPFIDQLQIYKKEFRKKPAAFFFFLRKISREKYDVVIDIYAKPESRLITVFSGARIRISYHKGILGMLYTHLLPINSKKSDNNDTTIEDRLSLLGPILHKLPDPKLRPRIFLAPEEIKVAAEFLTTHGLTPEGPKIMVGIIGSDPSKTYPLAYMARLMDFLVRHSNATLLLNYMPSQQKQAEALYRLCHQTTQKYLLMDAFLPDLRKFLAVLFHCNCYVGNEGGSVNMAKALGIPTFAVFSPWIHKKGWHTYADHLNIGVHLQDYFPEELNALDQKEVKKEFDRLYHLLEPSLFEGELLTFLQATRTFSAPG